MRDWHSALQSKAMRNIVLAMVAANVVGTYAAYVRLNQPVPVGLDVQAAAPTVADSDFGALPAEAARPLQKVALAKADPLPAPMRLQPIDVISDSFEAPVADPAPVKVQQAEAQPERARTSIRVAAFTPRAAPLGPSAAFASAFPAFDVRAAAPVDAVGDAGLPAQSADRTALAPETNTPADQQSVTPTTVAAPDAPTPAPAVETGTIGPQPATQTAPAADPELPAVTPGT